MSSGTAPRIAEHEWHTQRSVLRTVFMNDRWYIGFASSMCPKWPGQSSDDMPHEVHAMSRSIEPSFVSIRPPSTGRPPSKARSDTMWQTDMPSPRWWQSGGGGGGEGGGGEGGGVAAAMAAAVARARRWRRWRWWRW